MKRLLSLVFGLWCLACPVAWGQAVLENPPDGSVQSGISVVFGWKCTGSAITIVFDGIFTLEAPYGGQRNDTIGVCGDNDNGFGLLVNWNLLGKGTHFVSARDNGVEFASAVVTVQTLGEEFIHGASGTCQLANFPRAGATTTVQWQEGLQNFIIAQWERECQENTDCGGAEYCQKSRGDCDGQGGRCQTRPVRCGLGLAPICGCDGNTYGNSCFAAGGGVNVAHAGTCNGEPYEPMRIPHPSGH